MGRLSLLERSNVIKNDVFIIISAPKVLLFFGKQPRIVKAILTFFKTFAFKIIKELIPEKVENRRYNTDRRRRPYIFRGLNEQ